MAIAKKIYWLVPASVRRKIENIFKYSSRTNLTNRILKYYKKNKELITPEVEEVLTFLRKNWIRPFPYEYRKKYEKMHVEVYLDEALNMPYVLHNNTKMFFRKSMSKGQVASNYISLLAEQDEKSPHKYLSDTFYPNANDVIIDVGAAEGIFALNAIEQAKKIFLIESNDEWVEALHETFKPWKDKVEIIGKYASDKTTESTIALDDIYNTAKTVNFIKMDVEGYEKKVIEGSNNILLNEKDLKLNVCTYHKQDDGIEFKKILSELNFNIEFSKGYMLSIYPSENKEPYLRKGLLRAQKKKE